ncbi:sulfotransferase [Maioricimonas sp. JC845]|uniref:sulfotransferase family protein n=1 Tax=Maioricimonas sp. JC845 TaxID=3232138 RepID=UPI00345A1389
MSNSQNQTTMSHGSTGPEQPPQAIGKQRPSLQFPKCLLFPFRRKLVELTEQGWFGGRLLRRHIVICGFPRSGSTLLQLMVEACVRDIRTFGRERRGLEMAKYALCNRPYMMTKRPSDIFLIDELRNFYADRFADVRFVLLTRDPRAILTSFHKSRPGEYYVSPERWRAMYSHWQWACQQPETIAVRYEDLISNPDAVEHQLTSFLTWRVTRPFRDYHTAVPHGFETIALNGLRELDQSNLSRWQKPRYRDRLRALLEKELPELPQALIEMGYESDESWTADYLSSPRAAA